MTGPLCTSPPRGLGCAPVDGKAVHYHRDDTWWFWDETWSTEHGPYISKVEADKACTAYGEQL